MDREILFRGKRTDNGEWVEGFWAVLPTDEGEPEYTIIEPVDDDICLWHRPPVDPETVGQYTGLTDRNGKRIFEGDVVKYNGTKHEVAFEHMGGTAYFGIRFPDREESWAFGHYADPFLISVIGNIHDNPELIGGNNEQA